MFAIGTFLDIEILVIRYSFSSFTQKFIGSAVRSFHPRKRMMFMADPAVLSKYRPFTHSCSDYHLQCRILDAQSKSRTMHTNKIIERSFIFLFSILSFSLIGQDKVGINTTSPEGNLHIKGSSSISLPNLRITDENDNYARIKMESDIAPGRFWDVAASSTPGNSFFNIFFQNDTASHDLLSISGEQGFMTQRSFNVNSRTRYYTDLNNYRGSVGFFGKDLYFLASDTGSSMFFGTDNNYRTVLDSAGRIGLGTLSPESELDIRTETADDGSEVHLSNGDRSHFLRLFSGRQGFETPVLYWGNGDSFTMSRADVDGNNYSEFLRMDGKRIEVLNTGGSVFIGDGAGENDDLSDNVNTAIGDSVLHQNTTGWLNTAVGARAMKDNTEGFGNAAFGNNALGENTTGSSNTAIGFGALSINRIGIQNTAVGSSALFSNAASYNTGVGNSTLLLNRNGFFNTAIGYASQLSAVDGDHNTSLGANSLSEADGNRNTAVGSHAMSKNIDGENNIAVGAFAMNFDTAGSSNIAIGTYSLYHNEAASNNVAVGDSALFKNGIFSSAGNNSSENTAVGNKALMSNTNGYFNTAVGFRALKDNSVGEFNTAIGHGALTSNLGGFENTAVGRAALSNNTSGNGNTSIGLKSMSLNEDGRDNFAGGQYSMFRNMSGKYNVAIGSRSLYFNNNGDQNVAIGAEAGRGPGNLDYSGNVFIGYKSGFSETNSNRLYIENSNSSSPLIYGEFDNNLIRINGDQDVTGELDIQRTGLALRVNGDEALWYDDTYFSWGFGGSHNYFADEIRIGGAGDITPVADIHITDGTDASIALESLGAGFDAVIQFTDDASQGPAHQWTVRRDDSDGGKLQWRHSNFKKMTLSPGGNLGIGQSAAAINPTYTLYVEGSAGKPGGGSWSNPSDRRLKDRISNYDEGLNHILKINPVRFHYNELSDFDTEPEHVGVIAQELQEVAPYMVHENEQGYLDVNNSAMTYMLVNAVQKLAEKNVILEAELDAKSGLMEEIKTENGKILERLENVEAMLRNLHPVQTENDVNQ